MNRSATVVLSGVLLLASAWSASAQGPILWGGDKEGGAPFVFPPDDDPTALAGFEVDLAEAIGRTIGRELRFRQCRWDAILLHLNRGDIEVALNGYEFPLERAKPFLSTIPYYVYEISLIVRKDNQEITGWETFRRAGKRRWTIGVLEASAADRYCTEQFGEFADIKRYGGTPEGFLDVDNGRLDATVQDRPPSEYYISPGVRFPALEIRDTPAAPGFYVMYVRPESTGLARQLNRAVASLYSSGELKTIYDKYRMWNPAQTKLPLAWANWPPDEGETPESILGPIPTESPETAAPPPPKASDRDKWGIVARQFPLLLRAAGNTVLLTILSMPLAVVIGFIAALARTWHTPAMGGSGNPGWGLGGFLNRAFTVYVEVIRGTPLAFQLFVVYFVLPDWGIRLDPFQAGVIALAINYSAYEAEISRLGFQAIPRGQMEAAVALGMSRSLAVRRIILPQSVRLVIPATANDFIALFKDTAVCSVIAVPELAKAYESGAKSTGFYLEMAILASLLYLAMSYPLSLAAAWLERRLKRG